METKVCGKCKEEKKLSEFNKNKEKKDGVASVCKKCHSEYRKKYYQENKQRERGKVEEYQNKNKEWYRNYKSYYNKNLQKPRKRKSGNRKPNRKAGRTIPIECSGVGCNEIVYVTKEVFDNSNKRSFCSNECNLYRKRYNPYYMYLRDVEKRANKKKFEFDLNEEFIKKLLEGEQNSKCAVTGVEIEVKHPRDEYTLYDTASLDRIDSSKGYTKDNVRWVMLGINYMKMSAEDSELHETLKLIKENY